MTLHDTPTAPIMSLVRAFLEATVTRSADELVDAHFSDPTIVGDPSGARPVPSAVLRAAMSARATAASASGPLSTTLARWDAISLGPAMVLASATWRVEAEGRSVELTSDYLLDVASGAVRCVAYTTRQDAMAAFTASGLAAAPAGRGDLPS